jgi:nucleoside-diphosphate-sugar epimerase
MALVAVTGGTGLLGSALVPRLLARGHVLRLLTRPRAASAAPRPATPGVTWVEGSLSDHDSLDRLVDGADCILHAAYSEPGSSHDATRSPTQAWFYENFNATMRLLERCVGATNKQLIYTSSLAVFSRDPDLDPRGDRFVRDEECPLSPLEFYGSLRAACESLLRTAAHAYGLNTSIWRLGLVVGMREPWTASPFATQAKEAATNGSIRTPYGAYAIAVEDAAEILADAVGDASLRGRTYHTFDRWITHADIASPLERALHRSVAIACNPAQQPRMPIVGERIRERFAKWSMDARLSALAAALAQRAALRD